MKKIIILAPMFLTASCTSVNVKSVDLAKNSIEPICIIENPSVIVPNFLTILKNGIKRQNIDVKIVSETDETCKSVLTYTATRSWDITPYLSHAELRLTTNEGEEVGKATYHHNGGSVSLAPNKWNSAESKMAPVIDELFAGMPSNKN